MTREEKIILAIQKGITYDEISGKLYGKRGNEIVNKKDGYIRLSIRNGKSQYNIYAHHIAFYIKYNKVVEQIDHKNGKRDDNRIINLREVTNQQNCFNKIGTKGYSYSKRDSVFFAQIVKDGVNTYLGRFNTEDEARQAYLEAKQKYHLI
jgi:hypothetical protein